MDMNDQNINTGVNDVKDEDLAAMFNRTPVLDLRGKELAKVLEEGERKREILLQEMRESKTTLDEILAMIKASKSAPNP